MASSLRGVKLDQHAVDQLLRSRSGLVGREMSRAGGMVTREAQALTAQRLKRRTGQYAGGFRTHTERAGRELRTVVENTAEHATYLENGTRPHIIVPRNGRYLVFQIGGQTIFAQQVHHPGTKAYRILSDALRRGLRRAGL